MNDQVPEQWADITAVGSSWEVQYDPYTKQHRHRALFLSPRDPLSDDSLDWIPGRPPEEP